MYRDDLSGAGAIAEGFPRCALDTPPAYIGSEACGACHKPEAAAWRSSHHAHAMAHANATTVLGDFNNASFDYFGVRSRMYRAGQAFMVETDGPDGKLGAFEVKYTFGVEPLQQYLVEFPDGRVQALPVAWDTRPRDAGGQRWFHLYPNDKIGTRMNCTGRS